MHILKLKIDTMKSVFDNFNLKVEKTK